MKNLIAVVFACVATDQAMAIQSCQPEELEQLLRKQPYVAEFNEFQIAAGFAYGAWVTKYDTIKLSNDQGEREVFLDLGNQYMTDAMNAVKNLYEIAAILPQDAYCRTEMMGYIQNSGDEMVKFHNKMVAEFIR